MTIDVLALVAKYEARGILAAKTDAEVIAFYRAAGEAAMDDVRKSRSRRRKTG